MPNHRPEAIVNEFLRLRGSDSWPEQMFIQKLAYIAHGWSLAILDEPLSAYSPEAWDGGPVFREVWNNIRDNGYAGPNCELAEVGTKSIIHDDFTEDERKIIDAVWNRYRHMSGAQLSKMTHQPNTPWSKAYLHRGRNSKLFNEEIKDHYIALADAGRRN